MKGTTRGGAVAFASGAVFAAGLCVSGMTRPSKVLAFLDVAGAWDPSLAFVMVGAISVAATAFRVRARRVSGGAGGSADAPSQGKSIDARLVAGAALFGVGWGLCGLCPGPAIVAVASGQAGALVFVASMIAGMAIHSAVSRGLSRAGRSGPAGGAPHALPVASRPP